jgi:hypothetical protein
MHRDRRIVHTISEVLPTHNARSAEVEGEVVGAVAEVVVEDVAVFAVVAAG